MAFKQLIRRLFRRTSAQQSPSTKQEYMSLHGKSVLDVNKALETVYQKGVEHGLQLQPPLYGTSCPKHNLPLQETDPGHFICILDHALHAPQQTQPLPVARPGDFARSYQELYRQRGVPPGEQTLRMAAMTLRERQEMIEEMS